MVVDWFFKCIIFIPTTHACAVKVITCAVKVIGGMSSSTLACGWISLAIRMYDSQVQSAPLLNMFGLKLELFLTNHLQTDGQMDKVNALLEEFLRRYVTTR